MSLKAVFLGLMVLTSYQPTPAQTRPECRHEKACFTASGDVPSRYGCAVSQDLLVRNGGPIRYGDVLFISGIGFRVVNDTMNNRHKTSIDLMVWSKTEEHKIGVRRSKVWVCRMQKS